VSQTKNKMIFTDFFMNVLLTLAKDLYNLQFFFQAYKILFHNRQNCIILRSKDFKVMVILMPISQHPHKQFMI
jgi:hypothetical protein